MLRLGTPMNDMSTHEIPEHERFYKTYRLENSVGRFFRRGLPTVEISEKTAMHFVFVEVKR